MVRYMKHQTPSDIHIKNKVIGVDSPCFFIAEAGVNHNGSLELAYELIDKAKDAGADAIKFQTFKAENLNTKSAPKASYHVETTGADEKQTWFDLLKTQELSLEDHKAIIAYCETKDIIFMSTPYDEESADMLETLGVAAFKLASTDLSNTPFVKHIAKKGIPFIISTAMSTFDEVQKAVDTIREEGLDDFVVLQCTGNYPARLDDTNLRVMLTYKEVFGCHVGYSDHTPELINPIAATAMGGKVFEKHFTLDKELPGPDHRMSLNPQELIETIQSIRLTEKALGMAVKEVLPAEKDNRLKLRKSLVAAKNLSQGVVLDRSMVTAKRPGTGIAPYNLEIILGKKLNQDLPADTIFSLEMFT